MQSIFDKFSLQNLLRQFFCGFVFISSFCFFASGNATDDLTWSKLEGLSKGIPLELSWLIILAVAATIIGTIIYHLEKNLYSYSMQAFFESIEHCINPSQEGTHEDKKWVNIVFLILFPILWFLFLFSAVEPQQFFTFFSSLFQESTCHKTVFSLVALMPCLILGGISLFSSRKWCGIIALFLAIIEGYIFCCATNSSFSDPWMFFWLCVCVAVFLLVFLLMCKQVIERTQKIWIIETGTADSYEDDVKVILQPDSSDRKAIAQKLATWSDFIHCTQSCCFAWIVGCMLADGWCAACKEPSVQVAILILLLELLFDWHRYQHILAITKPQVPTPANK